MTPGKLRNFSPATTSPKSNHMRWEPAHSATSNHETYHLYKEDKKILSLFLNPFSNTARVECEKEKRVFVIRKEGFLRNKVVIRNEYGIKVGELGQEQKGQFIDINEERFFYTVHNNPLAELVLYKESKEQPLISCGLKTDTGSPSVEFSRDKKNLSGTSHPGLLMALCWYMFLPVTKENIAAFAS